MAHDEQDYIDGWQVYSNWIDCMREESEIISSLDQDEQFKDKFMSFKFNKERFKFVWKHELIHDDVKQVYKNDLVYCNQKKSSRLPKSAKESKKRRELGNLLFKDGKYIEALNEYTEAVKYAPYSKQTDQPDDDSLALALANRSATLYALTRYRLCLLDIELAIKYNYPKANLFKLLIRKVKCLHILSVWTNDVEDIKETLRNMLKQRDTKDFVKAEISNMFEFIDQTTPQDVERDELDLDDETVTKISNPSKVLTQAADCVEMSYESTKGRYLMNNKDISFGRLLIVEEPYVCNLAPSYRSIYCYNCCGRLYSCGLSCPGCTQVLYCSVDCQKANAPVHEYECNKFVDFHDKIGVVYLVAHIMFKIKFDLTSFPIYSRKTTEKKSLEELLNILASDWPDLIYKNDYPSVLALMDHSSDYDYDAMMGLTLTACYLMMAFKDYYPEKFEAMEEEQLITVGSIVLRHLMQLQTNLISVLDQDLHSMVIVGHSTSNIKERPIGVGIYPTISLLNHSCSPNILSIFHRNKFVARASKSLECGTEIFYCYGPSVNRMSKKDRQARLKDQYFFTCACESCASSKENESRALVCPKCSGPVIYNQDMTNKCAKCSIENVVETAKVLDRLKSIELKVEHMSSDGNYDQRANIFKLKRFEEELHQLVFWKNPLFVKIKSLLIECADNIDDLESAFKYCSEELELCDKTYGPDSLESIMNKLKFINFKFQSLFNKIEDSKESTSKQEAISELKNLLSTVNATRGKLKDLLAQTSIIGAEASFEHELKFLSDTHGNICQYLASLESKDLKTNGTAHVVDQ